MSKDNENGKLCLAKPRKMQNAKEKRHKMRMKVKVNREKRMKRTRDSRMNNRRPYSKFQIPNEQNVHENPESRIR